MNPRIQRIGGSWVWWHTSNLQEAGAGRLRVQDILGHKTRQNLKDRERIERREKRKGPGKERKRGKGNEKILD